MGRVRIDGIEKPNSDEKETGYGNLSKVKKIFDELGVNIPETVINRAL